MIHSESADMSQLVVIYRWSTVGGRDRQSALAGLITEFRAYGDNQELAPSTDTMLVGLRSASEQYQSTNSSMACVPLLLADGRKETAVGAAILVDDAQSAVLAQQPAERFRGAGVLEIQGDAFAAL